MSGSWQDWSAADVEVLAEDQEWRRLDPRMLLVHPVNEVVRFLPALIAIFFVGHSSSGSIWWHVGPVAIPIAIGIMRYFSTRFRITDERLELHRGVVSRNVLSTQLDKVRTVELTSSPIHRALGLAKVQIGTGSAIKDGDEKFVLDSLGSSEARALRHALLHRRTAEADEISPASDQPDDEILLTFDPAWIRFAPLTTGGVLIALGALAAGNQLVGPLAHRISDRVDLHKPQHLGLTIAAAVVVFLVVISVLSVIGYVLTNWGFTLSRDRGGRSLHIRKGMLTTRETSVELARVRGVEVHEPLGLRLAHGARAVAIVTGLTKREAGNTALVPSAPRGVVEKTASTALGESEPLAMDLTRHGVRATRRRYTRSLTVAGLLDLAWAITVATQHWSPGWYVLLVFPPVMALALARDRAARLGHGLTDHYLISQAHSFRGRRSILEREGIIGWNVDQTWFQRRLGLVTLTATTAAGKQGYTVHDIPEADAVRLAATAVPGLLDEFLAPRPHANASRT